MPQKSQKKNEHIPSHNNPKTNQQKMEQCLQRTIRQRTGRLMSGKLNKKREKGNELKKEKKKLN